MLPVVPSGGGEQDQPAGALIETNESAGSKWSVTFALAAGSGPLFVTEIV